MVPAGFAGRGGAPPEVVDIGILYLEFEPPAVDDDLDARPTASRRRMRGRQDKRAPARHSGRRGRRRVRGDVGHVVVSQSIRDPVAAHRGGVEVHLHLGVLGDHLEGAGEVLHENAPGRAQGVHVGVIAVADGAERAAIVLEEPEQAVSAAVEIRAVERDAAGEIEIDDSDKDKSNGVLYPAAQLVINKEGQIEFQLNKNPWKLVSIIDWNKAGQAK